MFLKSIKDELTYNNIIHKYLMDLHGDKLKNNIKLFNDILNNYDKSNDLINLIKNGNRN